MNALCLARPNCKGEDMAADRVLGRYIRRGMERIKDRPARKERVMKRLKNNGCELIAAYMAMGRFDLVLMV